MILLIKGKAMKARLAVIFTVFFLTSVVTVCAANPTFTAGPAVAKQGSKSKITFTVSESTDVEVTILGKDEKIIRHLAAGVLGGKTPPPAPLKKGLKQEIVWDGKTDTGKKPLKGPFKCRVRIGLNVKLDGFIGESKYWVGELCGLATDPKGNLYVYSSSVGVHRGSSRFLQIFNRDGDYQRTIMPMPVNLPLEKLKPFGVIPLKDGSFIPNNYYGTWPEFYPGGVGKIVPRVTKDGIITIWDSVNSIMRIKNTGIPVSNPLWRQIWPKRMSRYGLGGPKVMTPSPDGRILYLSGFSKGVKKKDTAKVNPEWPDGRIYRMDVTKPGGVMAKFVDLPALL